MKRQFDIDEKWDVSYSRIIVWKFQNFSVAQILREINFEQFGSCKTAVFAVLGGLNLVHLVHLGLQKV